MFRRRQRGQNFGVMLLALQMFQFGFDRIPPVTLVTILSQVAIFLGIGDLNRWFGSLQDVCISTHYVIRQKQWNRLLLGTILHSSDIHLYYNMASMLYKGSSLERRFKSRYFAYLLGVFTVLTSVTMVGINMTLAQVLHDRSYELQCAVGFSGVLFALKVLTTHYSPNGLHHALGFIPVPSKYIYWVELGIIQVIHPQASFTGHLAGILVGLMYTKGPLKTIMDSIISPDPSYRYTSNNSGYRPTNNSGYRPANTGYQPPNTRGYTLGGRPDTHREERYEQYTGGLSEEEQIRRATEQSRTDQTGNARQDRIYPDLDDLRRRRADRYT